MTENKKPPTLNEILQRKKAAQNNKNILNSTGNKKMAKGFGGPTVVRRSGRGG